MNNKSFFILLTALISFIFISISLYFGSQSGMLVTIIMSFITVGYIISDKIRDRLNNYF